MLIKFVMKYVSANHVILIFLSVHAAASDLVFAVFSRWATAKWSFTLTSNLCE